MIFGMHWGRGGVSAAGRETNAVSMGHNLRASGHKLGELSVTLRAAARGSRPSRDGRQAIRA
jgi:hypothetical protein